MMTTAVLWMRGILATRIRRAAQQRSNGSPRSKTTSKFRCPTGLKYSGLPDDKSVETMLAEGELDAVLPFRSDQAVCSPRTRAWRGCFPITRPRRWPISKRTGIFPDHACARHPAVAGGASIPGSPSICSGPSTRRRPIAMKRMAEPAHRSARLVSRRLGGAGAHSRYRSVGIRAHGQEPQDPRDAGRLFARTGTDQETAGARGALSQRRRKAASAAASSAF